MKQQNYKQRQPYPSDLSDSQWKYIVPLIPLPKTGGRPRTVDVREVINAILYVLDTGCKWRFIPHDFPKWKTVYYYFRAWRIDNTWKQIHDKLRERVRVKSGRKRQPSAGIIDSQSVKTGKKGGFVAMTLVKK